MRKSILTLATTLFSCSLYSFSVCNWLIPVDISLDIGAGYRRDNFKFETVADRNNSSRNYYGYDYDFDSFSYDYGTEYSDKFYPVYTSVLDWNDLNIAFIEGRGKCVVLNSFYFRGGGDYGLICNGLNIDDDYVHAYDSSPSRKLISKSTSNTNGFVYDIDIAAGYQFSFFNFSVAPLIGYAWKGQNMHDTDLKQNEIRNYSGELYSFGSGSNGCSISGLSSKYNARWNGPFIGFDSEVDFLCFGSCMLNYEFHWGEYHANAIWNLRNDMPGGFKHHAKNSYGHVVDLGYKYNFCDYWTVGLHGGFQYFRANHGRDITVLESAYHGNVSGKNIQTIELRKVQWYSYNVSMDIGLVF